MLILCTIVVNGAFFFALGGGMHWWFYQRRKAQAAAWKLQPDRALPSWREIRAKLPLVLLNLTLFNAIVGAALWCALNGDTQLFVDGHSVWFSLATAALPFLCFHGLTYYVHRFMHTPRAFRFVHSWHHRARAPCFVDAPYMHPIEAIYTGVALTLPMFLFPIHAAAFAFYYFVIGVHELLDHTGVRLHLPLFSPSAFHDRHHRSVRVCYGQAFPWLDAIHHTD